MQAEDKKELDFKAMNYVIPNIFRNPSRFIKNQDEILKKVQDDIE